MTTLWLRIQTDTPPEIAGEQESSSSYDVSKLYDEQAKTGSSSSSSAFSSLLPGASADSYAKAKWVKADPYFVSRLVSTDKEDVRLISRPQHYRGPDRIFCKGEYFDLLPNSFVQVYTRSDDANPLAWWKAQVINYLEEGIYSIKYDNDNEDEFYELHVTEDTWRPHFAFYDEGVARQKKSRRRRGGKKRSRCGTCAGCRKADCEACNYCLDMVKYGGPGTLRKACKNRICVALDDSDNEPPVYSDGDDDDDEEYEEEGRNRSKRGRKRGRSNGNKKQSNNPIDSDEDYQAQLDDAGEEDSRELIDGEYIDLHRTGATDVPAWYRGIVEKVSGTKCRIHMKGGGGKSGKLGATEIIDVRPPSGKWRESRPLGPGDPVELFTSLDGRRSRWNSGIIQSSERKKSEQFEEEEDEAKVEYIHVVEFNGGHQATLNEEQDIWRMPTDAYGNAGARRISSTGAKKHYSSSKAKSSSTSNSSANKSSITSNESNSNVVTSVSDLRKDDLIEIAMVDDAKKDEDILYWYRAQVHELPTKGKSRMKFTVKYLNSIGKFVHRALEVDSTLWRPVRILLLLTPLAAYLFISLLTE
jgi:hypothetical protein